MVSAEANHAHHHEIAGLDNAISAEHRRLVAENGASAHHPRVHHDRQHHNSSVATGVGRPRHGDLA